MLHNDDLRLSLSLSLTLGYPNNGSTRSTPTLHHPHPLHFNPISSSSKLADPVEPKSCLKTIDVDRNTREEDEAGVSSPISTISSISGKREAPIDEQDDETSRKKLRLSKNQSAVLEQSFKHHTTLNPKQKLALANSLGLRTRQVEVWFQNRRARTKLKQTEVDCDFLKRCCERLTEENQRLHKEVQELRALKMSPHFYMMKMKPPTTLATCPSCERVGAPASLAGAGRS